MNERRGAEAPVMDRNEQEAVDRIMEAVRRFADGVADSFNEIITATSASGELLANALGGSHPELGADLDNIRDAARRGWVLLGRLQTMSGGPELRRDRIDVGAQVSRLQETLERVMPDTIQLRMEIEGGAHQILGDASAIQRILMELATNARDAMPDGGTLGIYVRERGGHAEGSRVELIVDDAGPGMDHSVRDRAFDPFFTTYEEEGRSGLGLTIVFELVRKQGGSISVRSEPGDGTRICVSFPSAPEEDVATDGEGTAEAGTDTGRHRASRPDASIRAEPATSVGSGSILIVEDDWSVRQLAHRVLERGGFEVVSVEDAERALEFLTRSRYDVGLILSDLGLPGMDGAQLLRRTRSDGYVGPFILMSGHPLADSRHDSLSTEFGATFLAKPWTIESLQSTVESALRDSARALAG